MKLRCLAEGLIQFVRLLYLSDSNINLEDSQWSYFFITHPFTYYSERPHLRENIIYVIFTKQIKFTKQINFGVDLFYYKRALF